MLVKIVKGIVHTKIIFTIKDDIESFCSCSANGVQPFETSKRT